MKRELIDASQLELQETVVSIKRVTKVVKGGRNMRFAALVVVGDKNGHVGAGLGKAIEIPEAIRKGKEAAMKKLVEVPVNEVGSIPHDFIGKFGSASVLLKTSPEGTGIIAGGEFPCRTGAGRIQKYPFQSTGLQQQTERCTCYNRRSESYEDTGRSCETSRQIR